MRLLTLNITEELAGRTVKSLLEYRLRLPAHLIAVLKRREGALALDGRPCRTVDRVRAGEVLTADVEDAPLVRQVPPCAVLPDIAYEDEDLAVIRKSARMAVHGEMREDAPTVEQMLAAYWGSGRPFHPVNRLDKGTSGLMAVAKSGYAHERLRQQLHTEDFVREYLAVLGAAPPEEKGSITLPLARESASSVRRVPSGDGQSARTDYEVLARGENAAVVRVRLQTGRTHQIRAHFAALGCPLLGDPLYGGREEGLTHPALHSAFLSLRQPVTGAQIRCTAELPEDLKALLARCNFAPHTLEILCRERYTE